MTVREANSWRVIRDEIVRRINERIWQPGEQIPNEADLATEFRCGRTTVNRALRELATQGIVIRRRKAGTHVAVNPPHKAVLTIPIIREEIENRGGLYSHSVLRRDERSLPAHLSGAFRVNEETPLVYTETIHFSNNQPFIYEERYTSLLAVPSFAEINLDRISGNEWLVQNAPFSGGEMSLFAIQADRMLARTFEVVENSALFATERSTWMEDLPITHVRMVYMPGYRMRTSF